MTATRPRALMLAPAMPAEQGNGLAMRIGLFLEALARVAATDLAVLPLGGVAGPPSPLLERLGIAPQVIPTAGRGDTRYALLSRIADPATRRAAFHHYGRGSRHAMLSSPVLADLRALTTGKAYDFVHVARLYLLDAGLATAAPRRSLDLDEDDAWAWRQAALLGQHHDDTLWMNAEAEAEDRLLRRVPDDATLFISNDLDRTRLRQRHPGLDPEVVRNAVAIPARPPRRDDSHTLLFVGTFGYAPNAQGILWFAREVWPLLRRSDVRLRLRLVGPQMPEAIRALAALPGIEPLGRVENLAAEYARATIAIAPLHSGGGTRIKLIEAAAHGVPVVSTRLAAQGLELADHSAWLADSSADFAAAILAALADPAARLARAGQARRLVELQHDRAQEIERLACRFAQLIPQ